MDQAEAGRPNPYKSPAKNQSPYRPEIRKYGQRQTSQSQNADKSNLQVCNKKE